jgi:hypothetical protein
MFHSMGLMGQFVLASTLPAGPPSCYHVTCYWRDIHIQHQSCTSAHAAHYSRSTTTDRPCYNVPCFRRGPIELAAAQHVTACHVPQTLSAASTLTVQYQSTLLPCFTPGQRMLHTTPARPCCHVPYYMRGLHKHRCCSHTAAVSHECSQVSMRILGPLPAAAQHVTVPHVAQTFRRRQSQTTQT